MVSHKRENRTTQQHNGLTISLGPRFVLGEKGEKKKKTIGEQSEPNVLLRFCYFSPQQSLVSG